MDLVASIYRRLQRGGYTGTPISSLHRDEVQDFAQAELLMDLRCDDATCGHRASMTAACCDILSSDLATPRLLIHGLALRVFAGWWLTPIPCSTAVCHVNSICVHVAKDDGLHARPCFLSTHLSDVAGVLQVTHARPLRAALASALQTFAHCSSRSLSAARCAESGSGMRIFFVRWL
jgi:hypothetical protein